MKDDLWRLDRTYTFPSGEKVYAFRQGGRYRHVGYHDFWGSDPGPVPGPVEWEYAVAAPDEHALLFYSHDEALNELMVSPDPRTRIWYREKDSDDRWRQA